MSKLTNAQKDEFRSFLDSCKGLVGMADWKIILKDEVVPTDGAKETYATVALDQYEKELTVVITESFLEKSKDKQVNFLFHELLHARVTWFNKKADELRDIEEEYMVNDIVRGFEAVTKNFSFPEVNDDERGRDKKRVRRVKK